MIKQRYVYFDANPLIGKMSGVGYYTKHLIGSLAVAAPETQFIGHYFNFLGKKPTTNLPREANISYIETRLAPTKILNVIRRINIQIPYEVYTRRKFDFAIFTNFTSTPSLFKTPNLVVVHDLCFMDYPQFVADRNRKFLERWVPRSIKKCSILATISDSASTQLIKHFNRKADIITPIPPQLNAQSPKKPRIDIHQPYLLFVGNIEPRKNIVGLVNAFRNLPPGLLGLYTLVLAGAKGWKDEEIKHEIKSAKRSGVKIIETGYIEESEKIYLYKNASLYIQPSFYEGFGMPILEAMGHDTPVLCSNIPVHKEVAKDSAFYFDLSDPRSLGKNIESVLSDKNAVKNRVELAKMHLSKISGWHTIATNVLTVIDKVATKNRKLTAR